MTHLKVLSDTNITSFWFHQTIWRIKITLTNGAFTLRTDVRLQPAMLYTSVRIALQHEALCLCLLWHVTGNEQRLRRFLLTDVLVWRHTHRLSELRVKHTLFFSQNKFDPSISHTLRLRDDGRNYNRKYFGDYLTRLSKCQTLVELLGKINIRTLTVNTSFSLKKFTESLKDVSLMAVLRFGGFFGAPVPVSSQSFRKIWPLSSKILASAEKQTLFSASEWPRAKSPDDPSSPPMSTAGGCELNQGCCRDEGLALSHSRAESPGRRGIQGQWPVALPASESHSVCEKTSEQMNVWHSQMTR